MSFGVFKLFSGVFVYFIAVLLIVIPFFYFFYYFIYENLTFIVEKRLLKSQKKQEKYNEQLKRLSILNDSEAKSELVEEIENKLIHEEFNSRRFYYELKQKKIDKQKKELYRSLKKNEYMGVKYDKCNKILLLCKFYFVKEE